MNSKFNEVEKFHFVPKIKKFLLSSIKKQKQKQNKNKNKKQNKNKQTNKNRTFNKTLKDPL